jgi:hypothetical protein
MSKQTHNARSIMSFGASMSLMIAASLSGVREPTIPAIVISLGAMTYCFVWLAVNLEDKR